MMCEGRLATFQAGGTALRYYGRATYRCMVGTSGRDRRAAMALREGRGVTTAPVTVAVAFAFLADPRNAPEWFAPVTFAWAEPGDAPPQTALPSSRVASSAIVTRLGATWRFLPNSPARRGWVTGRRRAAIPMRMATYEPPTSFAWETTYPTSRDNLRWEITCVPASSDAADGTDAATTATTAEPDRAMDSPPAQTTQHTTIHMSLRIQPGPLGWVSLLVVAPFTRGGLDRRAQRALDRTRETLAARAELAAQPRPPRPPHLPRGDDRRGSKRKRRR